MNFCNAPTCGNPVFGKGYCRNHQYMREDFDRRSIVQRGIDKHKKEQKRKAGWFQLEDEVDKILTKEESIGGNHQWRWFESQRDKMVGVCSHCGGKTQKYDDKTFHFSIAHILPKAYFKSIATNDFNWIELCYYGKSCHANYDSHSLDLTELNCFDQVIERFVKMYPSIDKSERRRIPQVLLQYLEVEK